MHCVFSGHFILVVFVLFTYKYNVTSAFLWLWFICIRSYLFTAWDFLYFFLLLYFLTVISVLLSFCFYMNSFSYGNNCGLFDLFYYVGWFFLYIFSCETCLRSWFGHIPVLFIAIWFTSLSYKYFCSLSYKSCKIGHLRKSKKNKNTLYNFTVTKNHL